MKAIKLLIIISIMLPATGCVTRKACERKFPPETMIIRKDSIIRETKTVYRDTTIYYQLPGDTVIDSIPIEKTTEGSIIAKTSTLKTSLAESRAWIQNDKMHHTLIQNDTLLQIKLKDAIRHTWERAERFYLKDQTRIVEKKVVPLWVKILSFVGAATLMYLIYKITRLLKL